MVYLGRTMHPSVDGCSHRSAPIALSTLRRFAQLQGIDRLLLVEAWLRLALTVIALKIIGFRHLMRITSTGAARNSIMCDEPFIQRRIASIERAARHQFLPAMCLPRSVVLHQWLRQYGVSSHLQIGVKKLDKQFAAHAWIEVDGNVVYESTASASQFTPLVSTGGTRSSWGRS